MFGTWEIHVSLSFKQNTQVLTVMVGCRGALHHSKSASSVSYGASRRYVNIEAAISTLWCMAFPSATPNQ